MSASGLNIIINLQSALATLAQFLACLIASFLMDSIGPKILWIISSVGCLISLIIYSYCIYDENTIANVPNYVPVLSVFVYCLFFGLGQGPCPWAIFPAQFPDLSRYEGVFWMMLSHWVFSFVVYYTHPIITEKIGEFYAILIYLIICFFSCFYRIFFLSGENDYEQEQCCKKLLFKYEKLKTSIIYVINIIFFKIFLLFFKQMHFEYLKLTIIIIRFIFFYHRF